MLVLSRKLGEKSVIDDNIVITVVKLDRNQVRLATNAPCHVPIYREEICLCREYVLDAKRRGSWESQGRAGSAVLLERRIRARDATGPGGPGPYAGWAVRYTTPDVTHPFVRRVVAELKKRFPGVDAVAVSDPHEQTVEVIPPEGADLAEENRVGEEVEKLLAAIHKEMFPDYGRG